MIDIHRVRADTRAVDEIVHLNNAGSSLPTRQVTDAVVGYLRREELMGGYEAQTAFAHELAEFYAQTAAMLGCEEAEVAFASNASEAWWRAFTSVPLAPGDRVLAGRSEFQANAFGLLQARDRGVIVEVIPNGDDGVVDLKAFDEMLDERVKLVCLTQVSMANGAIHPAAEVGRRCRSASVPYLLDACQAAGQMPLNVGAIDCDFLVYTGRKFMRGPRGTGVLYARAPISERSDAAPFVDGRSAEWTGADTWELHDGAMRFEFGEQNFAGKLGLAVATRYALDIGLEAIAHRIGGLSDALRQGLAEIGGVQVHDEGVERCGIVTFTMEGFEPSDVADRLRALRINVSAPGRRNAQWDIGARGLDAVVRVGVHYFNTDAELDRLLGAIAALGRSSG